MNSTASASELCQIFREVLSQTETVFGGSEFQVNAHDRAEQPRRVYHSWPKYASTKALQKLIISTNDNGYVKKEWVPFWHSVSRASVSEGQPCKIAEGFASCESLESLSGHDQLDDNFRSSFYNQSCAENHKSCVSLEGSNTDVLLENALGASGEYCVTFNSKCCRPIPEQLTIGQPKWTTNGYGVLPASLSAFDGTTTGSLDVDPNALLGCSAKQHTLRTGVRGNEQQCNCCLAVGNGTRLKLFEEISSKSSSADVNCRTGSNDIFVSQLVTVKGKDFSNLEACTIADHSPTLTPVNAIRGPVFKKKADMMLEWFANFTDEQRNIFLQRLLNMCSMSQWHMLSLKMDGRLHHGCPENCRDVLHWLPEIVALHILSFLDPVSLCRASEVSKLWNRYSWNNLLWMRFSRRIQIQFSAQHQQAIRARFTSDEGIVQWRKVFAEQYLCQQNWIRGRCQVKTFNGHTQGVSCVQFDDSRIVSGSSDKTIRVWDIKGGISAPVLTLVGHSGTVRCLHLSGNRLISGSADRTIKVWDLSVGSDWNSAACRVTMVGHVHTVRCLQADEQKVISGSYDKTLKVWDLSSGACSFTLRGHNAAVLCIQFDNEKIVSGSYDNTIKVWEISTGECLMTLSGHQDAVTCLQFNYRCIISGSLDCTLKFWDLASGQCMGTIDWIRSEGHTKVVRCLQADSWKIVSAGDDKTLKIWNLESGQRYATLHKHTDGVTCLKFNDCMIVSGSYDQTVKLWDFSPQTSSEHSLDGATR